MIVTDPRILELLPHRPPFLWLDRLVSLADDEVRAEKTVPPDLDLFRGHYPGHPLMPGVLLCEMVFQAGALLIAKSMQDAGTAAPKGVPVITRILGAKFKREVQPGDMLEINAHLVERMGPAWIMKGAARVSGKVAAQVEFACTLKE